jgi:ankyrin repeat protein
MGCFVRQCERAVRVLLYTEAAVDARDKEGRTALMLAAGSGREWAVRLLLENEAAVNARDNGGETALMRAVSHGREDVVHLLLEEGRRWT